MYDIHKKNLEDSKNLISHTRVKDLKTIKENGEAYQFYLNLEFEELDNNSQGNSKKYMNIQNENYEEKSAFSRCESPETEKRKPNLYVQYYKIYVYKKFLKNIYSISL